MTDKIALTASMRSNLLSLKNTQSLMDKTQDHLSSGYKVNSAMDNPSSYFTAQSLNSRANDLSTLLDSIGQAISTLEVADQGITSLQDFVEQAKSVANSARDTSNVSASVSTNVKFDMDNLRSELVTSQVNGLTAGTSAMTIRVGDSTKLDGTVNTYDTTTLSQAGITSTSTGSITVGTDEYTLDFSGTTNKMETVRTFSIAAGTGVNTATFEVSDYNSTNKTVTLTDADGTQYKNVKAEEGIFSSLTGAAAAGSTSQEVTFSSTSAAAMDFKFTETVDTDGHTTITVTRGTTAPASVAFSTSATAANVSGGGSVAGPTIYVDNGGTVGDMAETIQGMIGNDKISVAVDDSVLKIKTLDTSPVEVSGDFADKFGFDKGTTVTLAANDTAESLRQKIANIDGVSAEFDKDGHMVVKSSQGDDLVISGDLAEKTGVAGAATNGNNERAAYANQFNAILNQIDDLVKDTSYKGTNLLNGDSMVVNFNENRTSTIELKGVKFDSVGLGFTQAADEWISNESIDKSLNQITKATSMLRAQASEFGQNLSTVQIREDFTQNMINNLQAGADKLTLADMNEEAANMLALQTRQSLGTNSLSLASQASQSVLRLF